MRERRFLMWDKFMTEANSRGWFMFVSARNSAFHIEDLLALVCKLNKSDNGFDSSAVVQIAKEVEKLGGTSEDRVSIAETLVNKCCTTLLLNDDDTGRWDGR